MTRVKAVVMYPRPHPDPICALFLLREFGADKFPGVREAKLEFWNALPEGRSTAELEAEGYVLIDVGGGKFDHHQASDSYETAATLVAKDLGVADLPALKKLLTYVRRDDLEGRGIVSKDVVDRAFGLSAITMNLNRAYPGHPEYVVEMVLRILAAHYLEEYTRKVLLPREWERLLREGKVWQFRVAAAQGPIRVVVLESDTVALVGFVRAVQAIRADVVVQRRSSGHTNIVTRQREPRLDLRPVVAALRQAEARLLGVSLEGFSPEQLFAAGRLEAVPMWYYDTAANTIQNGGAAPEGVLPTRLSLARVQAVLEQSLRAAPLGEGTQGRLTTPRRAGMVAVYAQPQGDSGRGYTRGSRAGAGFGKGAG